METQGHIQERLLY